MGGTPSIRARTMYIYVHKNEVNNVLKNGYMTIGTKWHEQGIMNVEKWLPSLKHALREEPNLASEIPKNLSIQEQIIWFLNWRHIKGNENNENRKGSEIIRAWYYPIPTNQAVRNFIKQYRNDYLKDKVLLSFMVDLDEVDFIAYNMGYDVGTKVDVDNYWTHKTVYRTDSNIIWVGSPFAGLYPKSGKISGSALRVVTE